MTIDKAKMQGLDLTGNYHLDVNKMLAEIERLQCELSHAKSSPLYSTRCDAERYRWLRDIHIGDDPESINLNSADKPGLSKAIDAAMLKADRS